MLKFMRAHATSWIIKVLLGLIIVVFIFWGVGRIESKKQTVVATVGEELITIGEYDQAYRNLVNYYAQLFGDRLSPEFLKQLNVKQQVLENLINSSVVQQRADSLGVRVGSEELTAAITDTPAFQREGRFDRRLYLETITRSGMEPGRFEEMMHRDLVVRHIQGLLAETAVVIPTQECEQLYSIENEMLRLTYVKIDPTTFTDTVKTDQALIEGYFAEHKEEFRRQPQAKVSYARFSPSDFVKNITVSEGEVTEYYADHQDRYLQPARVRVRHILIQVSPTAEPDEIAKAREKAEQVLHEAQKTRDFAALARKYSEDPSAAQGGDLGYVAEGQIDPQVGRIIFDLKKGDVSSVVQTNFGFHIFKAEDVQKAKVRALEDARDEIVSRLRKEKASELAAMKAEDVAYKARKSGGLQTVAAEEGVQVREAGPFLQDGAIPALGVRKNFSSVAFTLDKGQVSPAFQDGEDYFVVMVLDRIASHVPELNEIKAAVRQSYVSSRANMLARDEADELLAAWGTEKDFDARVADKRLKIDTTEYFKRSAASVPGLGALGPYREDIVVLTPARPLPGRVLALGGQYIVAKLHDVKPVDSEELKKDLPSYQEKLQSAQQMELLRRWSDEVRQSYTIEVNQDLLGRYK